MVEVPSIAELVEDMRRALAEARMMNVYSLFDRKLREYGQLLLERNDFGIQRGLADGVRANGESVLSKHPDDFDLYQVGEFDVERGVVSPTLPPRLVVNVLELVSPSSPGKED